MANLTLVTVADPGAADLIRSALELRGISSELVERPRNAYLGGHTPTEIEVRVAAEDLPAARVALEQLESETPGDASLDYSAGVEGDREGRDDDDDNDNDGSADDDQKGEAGSGPRGDSGRPGERRPRLWMGVPLALLLPVPVTLLYVGYRRAGVLFMSVGATALGWFVLSVDRGALLTLVVAKALDLLAAPLLVTRANRRAGGNDSWRVATVLTALLALLEAGAAHAVWQRVVEQSDEADMVKAYNRAAAQAARGEEVRGADGKPVTFPETPLGRMLTRALAARQEGFTVGQRFVGRYTAERDAWAALSSDRPDAQWLAARTAGALALAADLEAYDSIQERVLDVLARNKDHDDLTREVARRLDPARESPASRTLRSALQGLATAWRNRAALLSRPPTGDEADRAERQRQSDRQAALVRHAEDALRAITEAR